MTHAYGQHEPNQITHRASKLRRAFVLEDASHEAVERRFVCSVGPDPAGVDSSLTNGFLHVAPDPFYECGRRRARTEAVIRRPDTEQDLIEAVFVVGAWAWTVVCLTAMRCVDRSPRPHRRDPLLCVYTERGYSYPCVFAELRVVRRGCVERVGPNPRSPLVELVKFAQAAGGAARVAADLVEGDERVVAIVGRIFNALGVNAARVLLEPLDDLSFCLLQ